MELEELKAIWKRQKKDNEMDYSDLDLLALVQRKMVSFGDDIQKRDRGEIIACIVIIIIFGIYFFMSSAIWIKLGSAVIVCSALFIWYKLRTPRTPDPAGQNAYDHSVKEHLIQELQTVREQKKMLKKVLWWYIVPLDTGLVLITIGFDWKPVAKLVYIGLVILLGAAVWYWNQKAVKDRFNPLINEIEQALSAFEKETD